MYAVFVIAAILLSVSPMHARTLLAALPASAPGLQSAADDQDQGQQAASPHVLLAIRATVRQIRTSDSRRISEVAVAPKSAPICSAEDASLLEHAPNAP